MLQVQADILAVRCDLCCRELVVSQSVVSIQEQDIFEEEHKEHKPFRFLCHITEPEYLATPNPVWMTFTK